MRTFFAAKRHAGWWGAGVLAAVCAVWLAVPSASYAHKVTVFAWVDGDRVHTESKFSRGRMVQRGRILVYDTEGARLLEGETDEEGRFSFPLPQVTGLRVELDAGQGHRAEWSLNVGQSPQPQPTAASSPEGNTVPPAVDAVTAAAVRQAVEEALEARLDPVIRLLLEARDPGPSMTEILGGIGYIIGLAGLAVYVQYRRRRGGPPSS
jgi:nickel transport protein